MVLTAHFAPARLTFTPLRMRTVHPKLVGQLLSIFWAFWDFFLFGLTHDSAMQNTHDNS